MTMSLPVGIVGVGGIGQAHAANLSRMPEVGIAAVCDSDAGRAEHVAALYRVRAYTDWREMFARETLQAVYVCVPAGCSTGHRAGGDPRRPACVPGKTRCL
jgi:UDP-N-acetyl-2-amino-2-deoxyglucuronate dehydrogenase